MRKPSKRKSSYHVGYLGGSSPSTSPPKSKSMRHLPKTTLKHRMSPCTQTRGMDFLQRPDNRNEVRRAGGKVIACDERHPDDDDFAFQPSARARKGIPADPKQKQHASPPSPVRRPEPTAPTATRSRCGDPTPLAAPVAMRDSWSLSLPPLSLAMSTCCLEGPLGSSRTCSGSAHVAESPCSGLLPGPPLPRRTRGIAPS
jgi:hypothetical protein